jgi:hypothetical protein
MSDLPSEHGIRKPCRTRANRPRGEKKRTKKGVKVSSGFPNTHDDLLLGSFNAFWSFGPRGVGVLGWPFGLYGYPLNSHDQIFGVFRARTEVFRSVVPECRRAHMEGVYFSVLVARFGGPISPPVTVNVGRKASRFSPLES